MRIRCAYPFLLALGLTTMARSAELAPERIRAFGLQVGPTVSTASTNAAEGTGRTPRTGEALGAFGEIPIAGWLDLRPELNYLTKGSHDSAGNLTQLSYLEVPLLLQIQLPFRGGRLFFPFGPCLGFLMGGTEIAASGAILQIQSGVIAHDELSAIAGVGASFDILDRYNVFVLARFNYGLTNVARFQVNGQDATYYSRNLSLLVGVSLTDPLREED